MLQDPNQYFRLPLLLHSQHWGDDVDELKLAIDTNIVGVDVSLHGSQSNTLSGYLAHIDDDDFQVSFIRYGADVRVRCQQDDVYCFVVPNDGEHDIQHNKKLVSIYSGIALLPPDAELDMLYSAECGHLVLRFKKTRFNEEVFESLFSDLSFPESQQVIKLIHKYCKGFLSNCVYAHSRTQVELFIRDLKQGIIDILLNSDRAFIPCVKAHSNKMSIVLGFIKERLDWEFSINELSALAGLSVRSLYAQFKCTTGTSPYRYYLNCKLMRARLDLLKHGRMLSITDVAVQHGFLHFGRFASQYREMFGELPNQTAWRSLR